MAKLMLFMRPTRWLAHLPVAILPFLAAVTVEGPRLSKDVEGRVAAQLAGQGHGWAKPEVRGRDVVIRGDAPSRAAADDALAVARQTVGVRRAVLRVRVNP